MSVSHLSSVQGQTPHQRVLPIKYDCSERFFYCVAFLAFMMSIYLPSFSAHSGILCFLLLRKKNTCYSVLCLIEQRLLRLKLQKYHIKTLASTQGRIHVEKSVLQLVSESNSKIN